MTQLVGAVAEPAACKDRLDLVDAAFKRPGGPAAKELRDKCCKKCPIWQTCLFAGMAGEWGIWGGTSPNWRTHHGAPRKSWQAPTKEKS